MKAKLSTIASIGALLLLVPVLGFASAATETTGASGVIEIIWAGNHVWNAPDGNWMQTQIEEKFGVKIINHRVDASDSAARDLMIASGENLPDVGQFRTSPWRLYNDGVTRSIPADMVEQNAPLYTKFAKEHPPMWDVKRAPDDPDAFITISGFAAHGLGAGDFPYVRLDWLERVGMAPAASDVIQLDPGAGGTAYEAYNGRFFAHKNGYTLEELEAMMYTFRDADLDGNGRQDTIAYYMVRNHRGSRPISGMWYVDGEDRTYTLLEDGAEKLGILSDGWKSYLTYMRKWYSDKLINQELPAGSYGDMHPLMGAGKVGITADCPTCWDEATRPPKNLWDRDPEAKIMMIPHFIGPKGYSGGPTDYPPFKYGYGWNVNKTVDDEKLAKALQIMDWITWDEVGQVQSYYGVAGKHFEWASAPYNSTILPFPSWTTGGGDPDGLYIYMYQNWAPKMVSYRVLDTPEWREWDSLTQPPGKLSNRVFIPFRNGLDGASLHYHVPPAVEQFANALDTIRDEYKWNVIGGVKNLEEDWDAYVRQYMNSGGRELLAVIQSWPISVPPHSGINYFHLDELPSSVRARVERGEAVLDW